MALDAQGPAPVFNDYREAYGLPDEDFDELTSDADLQERLEALYGDIERLEWYVGIFAEEYPDYLMMGELMTYHGRQRRVHPGADQSAARSQRLQRSDLYKDRAEPLQGHRLATGIVARNAATPDAVHVSFSYNAKA